jgi:enamine deaminase RidA (YjgF/YER057c/UK114 family)
MNYEEKFLALGNEIPSEEPSVPEGCNFVLYRQVSNVLMLSGYGPFIGPTVPPEFTGKLGKELTTQQGYQAARLTAINLLLIVRQSIQTLNNVVHIIEVNGMVNCTPDFADQPTVINGCSDLLVSIFGDNGKHIRSAVGMNALAFNIAVEISISLLIRT